MGANATIGSVLGGIAGAVGGFLVGGPVGAVVGAGVGATQGGLQGDAADQAAAAMDKQKAEMGKQAEWAKHGNYAQAVAALQQTARGVTKQELSKHLAERERTETDNWTSNKFKSDNTPWQTGKKTGTARAVATKDTQMAAAFNDLRSERGNGKPLA